ncbi:acyl transferase/acyl hydrolase/lysophospholipase [Boletus coccyginus]|nr:acyl transferase/acyl hydrolase/lysophospholipase [Boletus coccyginus]
MAKVRKYILSIDGGGFRALSSLIILNHVMRILVDDPDEEPIPSPCQVFDLICGTSTGGIIAILLGRLGLDCLTAITIYKDLGPRVFGRDEGKMWSHILAGEQFSSTGFETFLGEVVEKYTGSQTTTMKTRKSSPDAVEHRTTDVFVTTVSSNAGSAGTAAYRLRSYATPRGGVDSAPPGHNWTIRQAARATSAAPTYFAPLQIGSQAFQDAAASGFNNPTLEALEEAELRWPSKTHELVVVSLGTGLASLLRDNTDDKVAAVLREKFGYTAVVMNRFEQISKQLVSVANDTESTHREAAKCFAKWKRRDDYFRFNPPQGLGDLDLADYMSEGTIVEITNVWLRSPDGKDSTLAAYERVEARKN